jgi:hypothetical protein
MLNFEQMSAGLWPALMTAGFQPAGKMPAIFNADGTSALIKDVNF